MNRANLLVPFPGNFARIEQEQVGITNHGCQCVVYAGPHVNHVSPKRRLALTFDSGAFSALRASDSLGAAQGLTSDENQCPNPPIFAGKNQKVRIVGGEDNSFARLATNA